MKKRKRKPTYAIRCLRAIEAFVGGRRILADELNINVATISRWITEDHITARHILNLVKLSDGHYSEKELLCDTKERP